MPSSSASSTAAAPRPLAPVGGESARARPTFRWEPAPDALGYHLQVATSPDFNRPLLDTTVNPTTTYTLDQPLSSRTSDPLYWRVRAEQSEGTTQWSPPESFTVTTSTDTASPVREARTSSGSALLWIGIVLISFIATMILLFWAGAQIP
jgi:hypothetical protein